EAVNEILLSPPMVRMRVKAGVRKPRDRGMLLQPLGQLKRVRGMTLDAQRQCLDALKQKEGIERRRRSADVTKPFDASSYGDRVVVLVDVSCEGGRSVAYDELHIDAQPRQSHLELVVRTAVEIARRTDVVARLGDGCDGEELRGLARCGGHRSDAASESRDAL